jgi:RNA polymerase sigma factor (TIGR02999 family)
VNSLADPASCAAGIDENTATDTLFGALYAELHLLARRQLAKNSGLSCVGATTLLHETYLDMAGIQGPSFPDRARFMGYAARVMRGLIIDRIRKQNSIKHGGEFEITSLESDQIANEPLASRELLFINDALDQLEKIEPDLAQIVGLKFFCGFSFTEIAAMQEISERTVKRRWEKARLFIRLSLPSYSPREAETKTPNTAEPKEN